MDVMPNTDTKKVEKGTTSADMTFYIENIRFHTDWRVYLTGTASNTSYDNGQKHAFMKIMRKGNN